MPWQQQLYHIRDRDAVQNHPLRPDVLIFMTQKRLTSVPEEKKVAKQIKSKQALITSIRCYVVMNRNGFRGQRMRHAQKEKMKR